MGASWQCEYQIILLDLLKDKGAHDNFLLREAGPTRFRRALGLALLGDVVSGALVMAILCIVNN